MSVYEETGMMNALDFLNTGSLTGESQMVSKFKHGTYKNYATEEDRAAYSTYQAAQRAKGGVNASGQNVQAAGDQGFQIYNVRQQLRSDMKNNIARAGVGTGWSPQAAKQGLEFSMEEMRLRNQSSAQRLQPYSLGKQSEAWHKKFGRWGAGVGSGKGWRATLSQAPASQSSGTKTQKYANEVVQTRETRTSGGGAFNLLRAHSSNPRLNSNLAFMYKTKNLEVGAVRRTKRII